MSRKRIIRLGKSPGKRDRSHAPIAATLRKQRQRTRQKNDGFVRLEILVNETVAKQLAAIAAITGGSMKEEAAFLVTATAARDLRELSSLADKAGVLWRDAQPFLPVASYLVTPTAQLRYKDRILTYAQWHPIQSDILAIRSGLATRRKWNNQRIDKFFALASKKINP